MPNAKFESGSFSSFGDMTSQNFPLKKGTSHRIGIFTPENGFNFKKMNLFVQNRSFPSKIYPHANVINFQAEEIFSLRCLNEKRAAAIVPD